MTNVEFRKLLTEVFEGHTLMKNRGCHTVNELLHMLRYDDKLRDLERVNINVIKSDGNCLCIPHIEAFVDVKSLGVWFEDISVEFEIEEFEVDDEMLKFSNITVYEREVM
jgi:hypothetical protein